MSEQDKDLIDAIRRHLDSDSAALDAVTRQRLGSARQQALAQLHSASARRRHWLPAGAMAIGAVVMIAAITVFYSNPDALPGAGLSDMELLVETDVELLEELDFIQWYELQMDGSDSGQGRAG